jgi:hypothetical protein
MPRTKNNKRIIEEKLLTEYGLLLENQLINPKNGRVIQATAKNISRLYIKLQADLVYQRREQREQKEEKEQKEASYTIHSDKKNNGLQQLKEILEQYKGKKINVNWNTTDVMYDVLDNFNNWFDTIHIDWILDSTYTKFQDVFFKLGDRPPLTISILSNANPIRQKQRFSEGINHCLFTPILLWSEEKLEEATTKTVKYRYNKIVNDVKKYTIEYKDGLPEDKINDICDILQIGIDICLPLIKDKFISHRSFKKPLKIFKFMNTKFNHIDTLVSTNNTVKVDTLDDMIILKKELDKKKEFYTYRKNKYIHTIHTLKNTYHLDSEYDELINEFENKYNIQSFKIDDITQPELSSFIKEGTHYNATVNFNYDNLILGCGGNTQNNEKIKLADMEKAYTQFKKCKYYNGFLGKITDFRKTKELMKVDNVYVAGLYRIDNINFKKCDHKFTKIITHLNCYKDGSVYPTQELLFLQENNVKFNILEGAYGVQNIDIEFPKEFNDNCPNGVKIYARYAGQCDSHNLTSQFWFRGTQDLFENIKSYTENNISFFGNKAVIEYKKEHNFHFGHFSAFITSYQRLNVFEQLLSMKYENIIRLCVDGIYYTGEIELKNAFRMKEDINFNNDAGHNYISNLTETYKLTNNKERPLYNIELHKGQGGNGKTHFNLKDNGNVKMLYIAPSWKLASNKKDEYKINSSVVARLTSKDPEMWRDYDKFYNVLIFDEVSMYSKEDVDIITNRYKNHKLIFCGDIGFQLPCVLGTSIEENYFKNHIEYKNNYRMTDDKLKILASNIRKSINEKVLNEKVISYFEDIQPSHIITKEELKNLYTIDDMILSSTHINKDEFTKLFTDKFDKEKYYITKNKNGYYNGEIKIEEKGFNKTDCEIRHCYTVHSIQGETAYNKLFIDMRKMNNNRLIYTAISRSKTLDQIYLIK